MNDVFAIDDLWKEMKKYMYPGKKTSNYFDYKDGDTALHYGYVSLVEERHKHMTFGDEATIIAAKKGYLSVLKILHSTDRGTWTKQVMNEAAENGHLDVVIWLHKNRTEGHSDGLFGMLNSVASAGHLEVLIWFNKNTDAWYSQRGCDGAAGNGHLHVVKWIYKNSNVRCTRAASEIAARNGHIHVLQWFRKNDIELSPIVVDCATKGHQYHIVQWLGK